MKNKLTFNIAIFSILAAVSVVLNIFDSLISATIPFLPVGARLGISNLAVCVAALVNIRGAFVVAMIKVIFVFVTRGATAAMMSFCGSMLATIILCMLIFLQKQSKWLKHHLSYIGISLCSATMHNFGQLLCSTFITGSRQILSYWNFMLLFALISGLITGIMLNLIMPLLAKQIIKATPHKQSKI